MTLFTIKYAPKNSEQVFGQDKAVSELKDFIINPFFSARNLLKESKVYSSFIKIKQEDVF